MVRLFAALLAGLSLVGCGEPRRDGEASSRPAPTAPPDVGQIRRTALAAVPGEILSVELERRGAGEIYEIKVLARSGRIIELKIDARTGAVLEREAE